MFNIINASMQVMFYLFQGYLLQYFLGSFLERRFFREPCSGFGVASFYGILGYGMDFVLPEEYGSIRILGKLLLSVIVICFLSFIFYRAMRSITIFVIVTFKAVSEICFFIAYMIMTLGSPLNELWIELYDKGYFASLESFMGVVEISLTLLQFFMYGVCIVLSYIFLKKIVINFRKKEYVIRREELAFILTPGLVGILLCVLLRLIMIAVEDGVPKLLYQRHPPLIWLVPAIMLLSLLSILSGVRLFQDMIDLHREKSSRVILEKQIENMQTHVKEVERIYSGVRSIKHDMKNSLSVVLQLASGNDGTQRTQLQAYLTELNQTMEGLKFQFKTGNVVVDTLLNMKYYEAMQSIPGIRFDADELLFPGNLNIQSYDIGVIVGNALDNAIEACRKLKEEDTQADIFIHPSSFMKGKLFFIEVENSFNGKVIKKKHSEFPATDKADKKAHGMGMLNIKNTVEKYHGAVDWSTDNNVFTLTVMIKNERSDWDESRTD